MKEKSARKLERVLGQGTSNGLELMTRNASPSKLTEKYSEVKVSFRSRFWFLCFLFCFVFFFFSNTDLGKRQCIFCAVKAR